MFTVVFCVKHRQRWQRREAKKHMKRHRKGDANQKEKICLLEWSCLKRISFYLFAFGIQCHFLSKKSFDWYTTVYSNSNSALGRMTNVAVKNIKRKKLVELTVHLIKTLIKWRLFFRSKEFRLENSTQSNYSHGTGLVDLGLNRS